MTLDVDALLGAAYRDSREGSQGDQHQAPHQGPNPYENEAPPHHNDSRGLGHGHGPGQQQQQQRGRGEWEEARGPPRMLPPQLRRPGERSPPGDRRSPPRHQERREDARPSHQWKSRRPLSPPRPMDPEQLAEQNARTIFATGLPVYAHMRELYEFFEKAGKVLDISLIQDRHTRRSKGFGYVEYQALASVPAALAMSGSLMDGHVVKVLCASEDARTPVITAPVQGPSKLYFVEVDDRVTEADLREFFGQVGFVERVSLQMLGRGSQQSKGRGYVKFRTPEDAKQALLHCNGYTILDKTIQLSMNANIFSMVPYIPPEPRRSRESIEREEQEDRRPAAGVEASGPGVLPPGVPIGSVAPTAGMVRPGIPLAGMHMPGTLPPAQPLPTQQGGRFGGQQQGTSCVGLKNMFDPSEAENDPNFDKELEMEVKEECSQYGPVVEVIVEKESEGRVYLKFGNVRAAQAAIKALNGRWFDGKQISATTIPESAFRVRADMRS